jgi:hypothetical protein
MALSGIRVTLQPPSFFSHSLQFLRTARLSRLAVISFSTAVLCWTIATFATPSECLSH